MKSFESIGLWFLPGNPDVQVPGTLVFSDEKGLTLALSGAFNDNWDFGGARYPLIHGVVNDSPYGRFITLFDGFATTLRIGMPGISLETIHAGEGFAGSELVPSKEMVFDGVSLSFSTLNSWLDLSGFKINHEDMTFSWSEPQTFTCDVVGAALNTSFDLDYRVDRGSISLEEKSAFLIDNLRKETASNIHSRFTSPLASLLTLASDGRAKLDRYQLYVKLNENDRPSHFQRLYAVAIRETAPEIKSSFDMLFTVRDVKHRFEPFMQKWFDFTKTHPDFVTMFFSYCYETKGFVESRFLFRMLAAECLVREEIVDDPILNSFELLRKSVLQSKPFIQNPPTTLMFPSAIEIAMPVLFAKFISQHWHLVREVIGTSESQFVEVLFSTLAFVNNRGARGPAVVQGTNLLWLLERLTAAIKLCVLKRLEFSDEKILQIIDANAQMSHLKNLKAPWDTLVD